MSIIIAIDYGTRHVGMAYSDETKQIAAVAPTISIPHGRKPLAAVLKALAVYKPESVLIGLPTGLDNKPTKISREVQQFGQQLHERTGLEIKYWNETLSSRLAEGMTIRKGSNDSHSQAAKILLQEYLDHINSGI